MAADQKSCAWHSHEHRWWRDSYFGPLLYGTYTWPCHHRWFVYRSKKKKKKMNGCSGFSLYCLVIWAFGHSWLCELVCLCAHERMNVCAFDCVCVWMRKIPSGYCHTLSSHGHIFRWCCVILHFEREEPTSQKHLMFDWKKEKKSETEKADLSNLAETQSRYLPAIDSSVKWQHLVSNGCGVGVGKKKKIRQW